MSHHLDSPLARQDVRLDVTDLYVFRGETGTVLNINVCHSLAGDIPVPGYHPEGRYEFKIDVDRDAVEDLTYRITFGERAGDGRQLFVLRRLTGSDARDPQASGTIVTQGSTGQPVTTAEGVRFWAGKAGDPFWIEPTVLGAVGEAFAHGARVELGDWTEARAVNRFGGHTVYGIVLEIPDSELLAYTGDDEHIDVWAVASLATDAGGWRPINRIGLPMIHPLFAQLREDLGDRLNGGSPAEDFDNHGKTLTDMIAAVVAAYDSCADPQDYAESVARRFLPNVLPYRVGSTASFGFAGWNGRSHVDNAPNVMFSLAANSPVTIGIGRESVTAKPTTTFPYLPPLV